MEILVELPPTLGEELIAEAGRGGVSPSDQAAFLLQLVTALTHEGRNTPFRGVVKAYLLKNALDADLLAEVLESLTAFCLKTYADPSSIKAGEDCRVMDEADAASILKEWRSLAANRPVADEDAATVHEFPLPEPLIRKAVRARRVSALGQYAHLGLSTEAFIAEKRLETEREDRF